MCKKSNQDTLQQFDCSDFMADCSGSIEGYSSSSPSGDVPMAENNIPMTPCSVSREQSPIVNSPTVPNSPKALFNSQNTTDYNDQDWMQYALALADEADCRFAN